jgi:hypothetical protein
MYLPWNIQLFKRKKNVDCTCSLNHKHIGPKLNMPHWLGKRKKYWLVKNPEKEFSNFTETNTRRDHFNITSKNSREDKHRQLNLLKDKQPTYPCTRNNK